MSTNHTTLHINCQAEDKANWVQSARVSGTKFESWVVQQLNAAKIDTNPAWAGGLSERARLGLLSAGFNSREDVQQAVTDGYDFSALNNVGRLTGNAIIEWAKS